MWLAGAITATLGLTVPQAVVGPGTWRPLYDAGGPDQIEVARFLLDERPITNAEFHQFVALSPAWRRDRVPELFADPGYLGHWQGPLHLGAHAPPDEPVTRVSWWAARAYCEERGARLPIEAEWELAAQASELEPDASREAAFAQQILRWYARPTSLRPVGIGPANWWGAYDLHGLVWEWVDDLNSAVVTSDNREDGNTDITRFCGASAIQAGDKGDYAAFMRVAHRSSLLAESTGRALGFRCANDLTGALP